MAKKVQAIAPKDKNYKNGTKLFKTTFALWKIMSREWKDKPQAGRKYLSKTHLNEGLLEITPKTQH